MKNDNLKERKKEKVNEKSKTNKCCACAVLWVACMVSKCEKSVCMCVYVCVCVCSVCVCVYVCVRGHPAAASKAIWRM